MLDSTLVRFWGRYTTIKFLHDNIQTVHQILSEIYGSMGNGKDLINKFQGHGIRNASNLIVYYFIIPHCSSIFHIFIFFW